LSGTERERIKRAWDKPGIQAQRSKLACLWRTSPEAWTSLCPDTLAPADLSNPNAAAVVLQAAHQAANRPAAEPRECAD
jgi:hypothetical protein